MGKKLYVGNLSYEMDNASLEALFATYGTVKSAEIIHDRDTGRSKGFAFVEMANETEADQAINALNGYSLDGRALNVNEARPKPERSFGAGASRGGRPSGGGGHRGGGGGRREPRF